MVDTPLKLSIVIVASNGLPSLEQCLLSLNGQGEVADTEILVVSNDNGETREMIRQRFPKVSYLPLSKGATVPQMRCEGILRAEGEIVALVEDHCFFDKNWCAEIKKAHEHPYPVVGGAIENASGETLLNWAAYFYDYGKYMLPHAKGPTDTLSGNNVSYKRSLLEKEKDRFKNGLFEVFFHEELRRQGCELYFAPTVIVFHKKHYELLKLVTHYFHSARSFAGMRVLHAPLLKRLAFALGSLILPILLPLRVAARIVQKGRHLRELWFCFPVLLFLMTAWSLGEFAGYVFGEGSSSSQWK